MWDQRPWAYGEREVMAEIEADAAANWDDDDDDDEEGEDADDETPVSPV